MTRHLSSWAAPAAMLALAAMLPAARAAGDMAVGGKLYAENCAECHSVKEGRNKKGPSLFGSFQRKAAALPDFAYSDALKASGIAWTQEQLDAYLTLPKKAVPGGKMKFDGLPDAKERADLIAYLSTIK
ncbi:c-type cytochrome [Ideonella azotifigens]|nr:c-type cytochrome [Ideonella azotifigens]MCD2342864.1 c-type cytochrome [Ideonella azotifigens]